MEEVKAKTKFEGNFKPCLTFLSTDEQFYFKTPPERLDAVAVIGKNGRFIAQAIYNSFLEHLGG
jgi:hypothetical protein